MFLIFFYQKSSPGCSIPEGQREFTGLYLFISHRFKTGSTNSAAISWDPYLNRDLKKPQTNITESCPMIHLRSTFAFVQIKSWPI